MTALYERHRTTLFGWLVRSTGDRSLAEDVFQETWMKAAQAIAGFDPSRGTFRAWLFRIAGNATVDRRRRDVRHAIGELDAPTADSGEALIETLAALTPAPDRQAVDRRFVDDLARALVALNDRQRDAVLLRHQQGLSYPEIALALDVPEGTAKTLVHRGVRILRRRLKGWAHD